MCILDKHLCSVLILPQKSCGGKMTERKSWSGPDLQRCPASHEQTQTQTSGQSYAASSKVHVAEYGGPNLS